VTNYVDKNYKQWKFVAQMATPLRDKSTMYSQIK